MASSKNGKFQTLRHIETVRNYLNLMIRELLFRGEHHDQSKLEAPEARLFDEHTAKLRTLTYGTPEYEESLRALEPALLHHYANNRHHPQHFRNGIEDMTIIDLVEMLCDWKASSLRQQDGNILLSLEENKERFHICEQLYSVMKNTIEWMDHNEIYHKAEES